MSLWRQLTRGLPALFGAASDREFADELDHYIAEAADAYAATGLSPDAARRAALADVGSKLAVRQQVRESAWEWTVTMLTADLRVAVRRLRRTPGLTVLSILTLAVGIGATTAIFSVVNPIVFAPLPYPHASRIVAVWDRTPDDVRVEVTFGTFRELVERSGSFDGLSVFKPWQPTLTGLTEAERLDGQSVSADYFRVLGVAPAVGRDFSPDDDLVNGPRVVMISDKLWRRRFGSDPSILGSGLTLNGVPYTIIGVLPAAFENVLLPEADIWTPLQYDRTLPVDGREWGHHLRMIARLRPTVPLAASRRDLDAVASTRIPEFARVPWATLQRGLVVTPLQDEVTRDVKPALLAILGAVVLLLAIACVNVTNLLLAGGAQRRGELAMRAALGAGRGRLVRQLLTETAILAAAGGGLGVAAAGAFVQALVAASPANLPRAAAIAVDRPVLAFALAATTLVGLCIGIAPALHGSSDLNVSLQDHSSRVAGRRDRVRRSLVVCEVALAVVLLVGAVLLARSVHRLFAVNPGFDASHVATMQVQVWGSQYRDLAAVNRFFDRALEEVCAVPGVQFAGWTNQLPLSGDLEKYGAQFESSPTQSSADDHSALRYAVTPDYFPAMRIPLLRGRLFDARDGLAGGPVVVLLSDSLARRRFPGMNPLGQRIHLGRTDLPWYTVVGVVADVRQTSLARADTDAVYVPAAQWYAPDRVRSIVVRAAEDPAPLVPRIQRAIWSVDKDQPVVRVALLDDVVSRSAAQRRFVQSAFEAFAVTALALAAIGIYGVLAGMVGERTREIGVRTALGASPRDVVALILRQGLTLTGAGVLLGTIGAAFASRMLVTLLFSISPLDPATYLLVVAGLGVVAVSACLAPAIRAANIDPVTTLRAE